MRCVHFIPDFHEGENAILRTEEWERANTKCRDEKGHF